MCSRNADHDAVLGFPHIEFVSGNLCRYCDVSEWLRAGRTRTKGAHFAHWPSLTALRSSASGGCEMCAVFVEELANSGEARPQGWDDLAVSVEVSFAKDSEGFYEQDKDTLEIFVGGELMFLLEFYVDRDCKIPQLTGAVSGRTIEKDSASANCFARLDEWLSSCRLNHKCGKGEQGPPGALPKRLADISDELHSDGVRIYAREQLESLPVFKESEHSGQLPYAYLSYIWGSRERDLRLYATQSVSYHLLLSNRQFVTV
jgi:hypothetical protein